MSGEIYIVTGGGSISIEPTVREITISSAGARGAQGPAGAPGSGASVVDTAANLSMTCLPTTTDGDLATATALAATPHASSSIRVEVNGIPVGPVVFGQKTGTAIFFSLDNGVTALARPAVTVGATLHYNGSVVGYQLDSSDRVSVIYEVIP